MSRRRYSISDHTNFLIWQESLPSSNNQPPSQTISNFLDEFPIEFHMRRVEKVENYIGYLPLPLVSYENTFHDTKSVRLPKNQVMLQDNDGNLLMSSLLRYLDIPARNHGPVLQKISSVASSAGRSRMPIVVNLLRTVKHVINLDRIDDLEFSFHEDDVADDMIVLDSMETYEPMLIPATKSSIQALEKVKFQQGLMNSVQECTICMEGFQTGLEVTRMPCSHVYHEGCIVKWLKTSHFCPLCRYPMPHDC